MNRKQFFISTGLTAFSMTALGNILKTNEGNFKGDCKTTNDILGPFYRENAPVRNDLTFANQSGNNILLKGNVFKNDCVTPIKDATIEIWHCNIKGEYDNDTNEFRNRAQWLTNEKGEYSFITILPGKYLNGALYRPSHIHFRITAKGYKEIVSQIYFKGDPHIAKDEWASDKKAIHRILEIVPEDTKGGFTIFFNIYLENK
ncbi:MAG: hypothetical protein ACKVQB_06260 [Bacteroidia bacterium]